MLLPLRTLEAAIDRQGHNENRIATSMGFMKLPIEMPFTDVAPFAKTEDGFLPGWEKTESAETAILWQMGILSGNPDGTVNFGNNATRAEAAAIIERMNVRWFNLPVVSEPKNFQDTRGHWAEASIRHTTSLGIFSGYNDNEFGPGDNFTVGQLLAIMMRFRGAYGIQTSDIEVAAEKTFNNRVITQSVEINPNNVPITTLERVSEGRVRVRRMDEVTVTFEYGPQDNTFDLVYLVSERPDVASITNIRREGNKIHATVRGNITGSSTQITARRINGPIIGASVTVMVDRPLRLVTKFVYLASSSLLRESEMQTGQTLETGVGVTPSNADNNEISFASTDTSVFQVVGQRTRQVFASDGRVTETYKYVTIKAVGRGTADLVITALDEGGHTERVPLTVE
jgi:hypothetical protein